MEDQRELDESLTAVSPIDGRYRARTRTLAAYFSEFALIRYRVRVEIEWLISLAANPEIDAIAPLDDAASSRLRAIWGGFSLVEARRVKELEAETNHDVKAVEYFLKERIAALELKVPLEMVHFACTSEDINNLAYALILKDFLRSELVPRLEEIQRGIAVLAYRGKAVAMMARTHGQEAAPTTVGKEMAVFVARLERQMGQLRCQEYLGKMNGAVGNYNAHRAAYPEVDWIGHSRRFVEGLGLVFNPLTTQIESHDFMAELFDTAARIDTVLLDFARDMWGYIALGYFAQRAVAGEVGSSAMPHKVNPIDFENAEGNLGLATALFQHLATKLPVSRWQRDLSDSTALRALGTAFGHMVVALAALSRGLNRVEINLERLGADLDDEGALEVLAEAVQTVMRRHGLDHPYERLKALTRGRRVTRRRMEEFIAALPLDEAVREKLRRLSPRQYLGFATELVERFVVPPEEKPSK